MTAVEVGHASWTVTPGRREKGQPMARRCAMSREGEMQGRSCARCRTTGALPWLPRLRRRQPRLASADASATAVLAASAEAGWGGGGGSAWRLPAHGLDGHYLHVVCCTQRGWGVGATVTRRRRQGSPGGAITAAARKTVVRGGISCIGFDTDMRSVSSDKYTCTFRDIYRHQK